LTAGFALGWLARQHAGAKRVPEVSSLGNRVALSRAESNSTKPEAAESFAADHYGEHATDPEGASVAAKRCFAALQVTDPERRFAAFLLALDGISAADVPVIFAKIKTDDKLGRGVIKEWDCLIQKWGELDHTVALDFAKAHDTDSGPSLGLRHGAARLGTHRSSSSRRLAE
jgi:hypothetical protein